MGVPKFFRYISERYPCLSELVKEYQIPEFDNLYLDMNGIIHMCSHPDDYDPHFRISEEKIFSDIFHYIEILFRMIKPQKLFFMAVDGVAPRAKMNQQRGRRFRSAKEAEVLEAKAKEKGEELPKEARFDSNCITPGTVFMARLHEQLKYFVSNKISTDKLWQKCKIILSGHETPGEGEHKIMDYIRYMKAQPGYDPNTRHCLYGLDADLIMLGLCTHEPHFSLLREEVRFGKKAKRKNIPEQITFYLLHLSLMRQYLELEFMPLKETLPFEYDMEKIIDDWVLMGFLVGNDFIPHLPNLHIANGALPILYNAYMKILPTLDGYINEFGNLHLERFEKFMAALAAIDMEHFSGQYADLKYFQSKTGRRPNDKERTSYKLKDLEVWLPDESDATTEKVETNTTNKDLAALIKSTDDMLLDDGFNCATDDDKTTEIQLLSNPELHVTVKVADLIDISSDSNEKSAALLGALIKDNEKIEEAVEAAEELEEKPQVIEPSDSNLKDLALDELQMHDDDDDEDLLSPYYSDDTESEGCELMNAEFIQHKNDYYMNKLDYIKVTPEVMRDQAEGYVRAIQWNLHYYYNGVCSWSWYYPHHYAPYISDIKDFANLKLEYELGCPFKPFEQLLAVLPAASKTLLPEPYQELMTSEQSSIIEYYPQDFRTDLNGKKQEWEAVVLIPFIAEDLLLKAMGPCNEKLSEEEKQRNSHGPMLVYEYTATDLGVYKAPDYFPTIQFNHAKLIPLTIEDIRVPIEKLVKGLCPGAINEVYYPGFPTMKHLKYEGHLEKAKVRVFDTPSQNENMIVKIIPESKYDIEELAREILGKSVHVAWPHLIEALVVSVSDLQCRYHKISQPGKFNMEVNKGNLQQLWHSQKQGIVGHYKEKLGIDVDETNILVHVKQLTGQKYSYTSGGRISLEKQWANVESCYPVQSVIQNLVVYEPEGRKYESIQDLFPIGSKCFMLGHPHYGSIGIVTDNTSLKSGRIKVSMQIYPEPDMSCIHQFEQEVKYMHGSSAAQRLAITSHLLSRITGCIFAVPGVKGNSLPKNSSKMNLGLNLKLNKKNEEIPGYTKKVEGQWLYTQKSISLVRDYMQFCPELFAYLSTHLGNDIFYESELFPNDIGEGKIQKIVDWIKQQPFSLVERQKVGSKMIDPAIVQKIEETVDSFKASKPPMKTVVMQIKPHLLFKPEVQTGNLLPDNTATYQLYDRVVNVREAYTVPFGCKGTVIGIQGATHSGEDDLDVMLDVVFDEPFPGGLQFNCSPNRGYRVPKTALINISHGMRSLQQKCHQNPTSNNNSSVQSQNSAFASWNNNNSHYRQPVPLAPHLQQQRMFLPTPQIQAALNHHRMPIAPPNASAQSLHHRPAQANQPVSAEFLAFFQDLQKNQDKNKLSSTLPQPLMEQKVSPRNATFTNSKSPQHLKKDSTEETEALKKLLNISAKHSPKKSAPSSSSQKNISQQISVQDLFTHARNKEQKLIQQSPPKSAGYTVQLLHYCQTQGIGVPRYCYFPSNNNRIRAQVTLQDGRMVIGDESPSREDAAEMAAKIIMNDISQMKSYSPPKPHYSQRHQINSSDPGHPKILPVPPKQWYQKPNQQKSYKANNLNMQQQQQQQSNSQIVAKSLNIKNVRKELARPTEKQTTSFVPLQAVKKQRNKSINEPNDMKQKKENVNINDKADKNKSINAGPPKNAQLHLQSSSINTPERKQRRSRIAANFSGLQGEK